MATKNVVIRKFKDAKGDWRWHARARNGRIVAEGGEGYTHEEDLDNTLAQIIGAVKGDDYAVVRAKASRK